MKTHIDTILNNNILNKKYPGHKIFKKGTEVAKTAPKSA